MRAVLVTMTQLIVVVGSYPGRPSPEKFAPLVSACVGLETMSNCTAKMTGVCVSESNGVRHCANHFAHHGHHRSHHNHHHVRIGDCGAKIDGEKCTMNVDGHCIPSGKCPLFHGQMVCRPNDAHPPTWLTAPCKGKHVGDKCIRFMQPGICWKGKYSTDMVCKSQSHETNAQGTKTEDADESPKMEVIAQADEQNIVAVIV
eukprot:TRINITY_DN28898_c0_g1_i1.p1 TRINITY_DN28898_c0_g1~~TRINITY_DN28898_c0_g1_i1.p1  ORF type:complete len:235 (+),score=28.12 TRINITY_DN28898_c0_g1_i1:103-705(+)